MVLLLGLRLTGRAETRYVALAGSHAAPYTNWLTAATTIQAAVDVSVAGDFIWVTDGVYRTGTTITPGGSLPNRVVITDAITVRSVNGPYATHIRGVGPIGTGGVRCVYMNSGKLIGFTLTNGFTLSGGNQARDMNGGGASAVGAVIESCRITGCGAQFAGGGVYGGDLRDCFLGWNSSSNYGGAAWADKLSNCVLSGNSSLYGGALYGGTSVYCQVISNLATYGGGAYGGTLRECVLRDNQASQLGGGVSGCVISNCTVVGNRAAQGGGAFSSRVRMSNVSSNSATLYGGAGCDSWFEACIVVGNSAADYGGAAYLGGVSNCLIRANSAGKIAAGLFSCTAHGCTITDHVSSTGGVVYASTVRNCIIYHNGGWVSANTQNSYDFCCLPPGMIGGIRCIYENPRILSHGHIAFGSPCISAGNHSGTGGADIDGDPWGNPPSIGCDEPMSMSATGTLVVAITATATQIAAGAAVPLRADVLGVTTSNRWHFGDGVSITNASYLEHAWQMTGTYTATVTAFSIDHPAGITASISISVLSAEATTVYVWTNSPTPAAPFNAWSNAAHSLQEGVNAQTLFGGWVVATDGVYRTGGMVGPGSTLSNRVIITNWVHLKSVNGAECTTIEGAGPAGPAAMRCVYLDAGTLTGFTLTNGYTQTGGSQELDCSGGGILALRGRVADCRMVSNSAAYAGGGARGGTLVNCYLMGNTASNYGGGASSAHVTTCTLASNNAYYGGAVDACQLEMCSVEGNRGTYGGGAYRSVLKDCLLNNHTAHSGGAAYECTLFGCTLTGNTARAGGAAHSGVLFDCVVSGNSAIDLGGGGAYRATLIRCRVEGNAALYLGGGAYESGATNCSFRYNSAEEGGAACAGNLSNCEISGNVARKRAGGLLGSTAHNCTIIDNEDPVGGGIYGCTLRNCILYYNRGIAVSNNTFASCCVPPRLGYGVVTGDP